MANKNFHCVAALSKLLIFCPNIAKNSLKIKGLFEIKGPNLQNHQKIGPLIGKLTVFKIEKLCNVQIHFV